MAVAIAALDALVSRPGPAGERVVPFAEFHRLPGDTPERDTVLEHGELITSIDLPALPSPPDRATARSATARPTPSPSSRSPPRWKSPTAPYGGCASHSAVWRTSRGGRRTAEEALVGTPATAANFRAAVEAELAAARPLSGNAFKVPLARNVVVRMLTDLAEEQR